METDIKVELARDGTGWYWAFLIDGDVAADGVEGTREEALHKARLNREEWEHRNDD